MNINNIKYGFFCVYFSQHDYLIEIKVKLDKVIWNDIIIPKTTQFYFMYKLYEIITKNLSLYKNIEGIKNKFS